MTGRILKCLDMEGVIVPGLTDDEILARYRQRNPYLTMSAAKAMYRLERRYRHLKGREEAANR